MPARHCIIHKIDKKPDGSPAAIYLAGADIAESQARDDLVSQFNETYNATAGKVWGFFHSKNGDRFISTVLSQRQKINLSPFTLSPFTHACTLPAHTPHSVAEHLILKLINRSYHNPHDHSST